MAPLRIENQTSSSKRAQSFVKLSTREMSNMNMRPADLTNDTGTSVNSHINMITNPTPDLEPKKANSMSFPQQTAKIRSNVSEVVDSAGEEGHQNYKKLLPKAKMQL